jgi:hypothetical protein
VGRAGIEPATLGLEVPLGRIGLSRCVWGLQGKRGFSLARVSARLGLSRRHRAGTHQAVEEVWLGHPCDRDPVLSEPAGYVRDGTETLLSLACGPDSYFGADAAERLKKAHATSAPQA